MAEEQRGGEAELLTAGVVALPEQPATPPIEPAAAAGSEPSWRPARPWGPWATLGLLLASVVMALIVTVIVGVALGIFSAVTNQPFDPNSISLMLWGSAAFLGTLTLAVILWSLIPSVPLREYLALKSARKGDVALALGATVLFVVIEGLITTLVTRDLAPFMLDLVADAAALPAVLVVVLVVAPVTEEIIFRGFAWKGLAGSAVGPIGAAVITSFIWMLLHVGQYGPIDLGLLFVFGLLLGWGRHRSGSVFVPMAMHLLMNAIAMGALLMFYA